MILNTQYRKYTIARPISVSTADCRHMQTLDLSQLHSTMQISRQQPCLGKQHDSALSSTLSHEHCWCEVLYLVGG